MDNLSHRNWWFKCYSSEENLLCHTQNAFQVHYRIIFLHYLITLFVINNKKKSKSASSGRPFIICCIFYIDKREIGCGRCGKQITGCFFMFLRRPALAPQGPRVGGLPFSHKQHQASLEQSGLCLPLSVRSSPDIAITDFVRKIVCEVWIGTPPSNFILQPLLTMMERFLAWIGLSEIELKWTGIKCLNTSGGNTHLKVSAIIR